MGSVRYQTNRTQVSQEQGTACPCTAEPQPCLVPQKVYTKHTHIDSLHIQVNKMLSFLCGNVRKPSYNICDEKHKST